MRSLWTLLYIGIALILCQIKAKAAMEQSHSTSVAGMVKLVLLEAKLIENLSSYADELEKKLNILKRVVPLLQEKSNKAMSQMEQYVSNPINAFSLIRRLHKDWNKWKLFMEEPLGSSQVAYVNAHESQLPSQTDLDETCQGLHRLYDVYNLTVKDIARGLINGKQYDTSLGALDTYAMGKYLDQNRIQDLAMEWFAETGKLLMEHTLPIPMGGERQQVLQLFARAFIKQKHYTIALPLLDHALMKGNKTNNSDLLNERAQIEELVGTAPKLRPSIRYTTDYARGCRGQFVQQTNLICKYKFRPSPFLRLAPLKMEVLVVKPFIVAFHDVLSPHEIGELQQLAMPLLKRTTVYDSNAGLHGSVKGTRTSKGIWLSRSHNNLTKRIGRRISDMTGFHLEGSTSLQVMNYGLSGHYALHTDYFNTAELIAPESPTGDRIATVLFYLSDVEQGGDTVFPRIEQAFKPERGKALLWYNLHRNGTGDKRTEHGACPVLVGSKWIMTQWINERPQLFARPCLRESTK
ncbi:prolyl 4-hydroxylase subunit alpha-2 isoform X1 [Drosophila virilis]|uniref:procollagen-proline 4-dioxygenase n=2 Tax=Drosophila virilis TaxID=7244 RepID=B4LW57_DROVI|nr:prolyl 4-hydroxylase subunit alpha-2 isoform X1 [Drosophila virilis]XP_015027022.1 prolyl 4-hydroxylase subunit alpha-2 isoform X1 [Drosophila virilis]EDW67591.2 uncharacterized protein Dvir_GJ22995, isoform D [Drosophila virilis]KRF83361.1 uncharacterized protein Dvir_GJ22995, isoform B [Drosophila virilis]